jgi:glycosyltransferase involved in cell wall biosynthesis
VWSLGFRLNVGAVPQAVHYHDIGSFIRIHPATARQRIKSLRERSDLKRTDLRIYNSATMRDAVHSRYPAAATRPHVVIHNGLNLTPFRTTQTEAARRRADRTGRSILLPQSDAPHKRNWLAADVLALLRDREPTSTAAQLTVTGSGDYLDLRERLKHHGLEDVTTFTGYVTRERMATLYAEHDAVLMTARAESFGNPIVEAHAASRPVITSPFPVAIELGGPLTHVATADDACSLADALHRALETPIDGGTIREARRFAQKFTASTAAQRISVALGAAVEAGRAGRRAG